MSRPDSPLQRIIAQNSTVTARTLADIMGNDSPSNPPLLQSKGGQSEVCIALEHLLVQHYKPIEPVLLLSTNYSTDAQPKRTIQGQVQPGPELTCSPPPPSPRASWEEALDLDDFEDEAYYVAACDHKVSKSGVCDELYYDFSFEVPRSSEANRAQFHGDLFCRSKDG